MGTYRKLSQRYREARQAASERTTCETTPYATTNYRNHETLENTNKLQNHVPSNQMYIQTYKYT